VTTADFADILAFALVRLAEEESLAQAAQAANPGRWYAGSGLDGWIDIACDDGALANDSDERGAVEAAAAQHAVRQQPAATLARVAALRALLALHEESGVVPGFCRHDTHPSPCLTLHHVAAIWSWHPDYRTEWKL